MGSPDLLVLFEQWAHLLLEWIGFGTLVGLLAKAIMPGRDPGGPVTTLAMGIAGTVIGLGTLAFFYQGQRITPISPLGIAVGTAGAFVLLLFGRLLGGYWFLEGDRHVARRRVLQPRRARRYRPAEYVETDDRIAVD